MVKKSTKSKSKRISLRKKHKILAKVKAHGRKERRLKRKQAKENKALGIRPRSKDPGVPESWPFREDFIKEMAFEKNRIQQEKNRKKAKTKAEDVEMEVEKIQHLLKECQVQEEMFSQEVADGEDLADVGGREHFKEFHKVVAMADVVLQVLDARDPEGCRSTELEMLVRAAAPQKRLVFLLNKIDLVPRVAVESWLKHLRQFAPCIAFRCSTQRQNKNLGQTKNRTLENHSSICLGADHLIQLLKNYTRNADIKTAITVGLVGVPNVGKSSVINSLKRSRSAHVGNKPGITTHVQEFHLDKQIRLLDSPGVIYEKKHAALQGVLRTESLVDPVETIEQILKKIEYSELTALYQIEHFDNCHEFLQLVAKRMGKLKKGGIADIENTAKIVVQDWNNGRIPFYTTPPMQETAQDVQIVDSWGQAFSIDEIYKNDGLLLDHIESEERSEMKVGEPEPIAGGFEAFSKMADIREAKAAVAKTNAQLLEMHVHDDTKEENGQVNPVALDSHEASTLIKPETISSIQKGVQPLSRRKGQKMSKQDKELYNAQGQYNPHRVKARKKQLKKISKSIRKLTQSVSNDLKL